MPRYRKKPVVIDAVQWTGVNIADVLKLAGNNDRALEIDIKRNTVAIDTLEGTMTASVSDWIIRGVKGELYPCKDEIFRATYEAAE